MLGAIIGDIVGSRFEWNNHRSKEFELFTSNCFVTDDSIMSLAVGQAILACRGMYDKLAQQAVACMQDLGQRYPDAGYGGRFGVWLYQQHPKPYNSWGNGAAMRVSACAWAAGSLEEALFLSDTVTAVTHNHPEGLKGARATTAAIWLARQGADIKEIRQHLESQYYLLDFTLDAIRPSYRFNESCQQTVPQALVAFLESQSFEDAIRGAISIGGDSDTLAAITGSVAQAYYGIPDAIRTKALAYLDQHLSGLLFAFEKQFPASVSEGPQANRLGQQQPGQA